MTLQRVVCQDGVVRESHISTVKLQLDLACGRRKKPGFIGVDISPETDADVVCDLRRRPWPWRDGSVVEVYCGHFFEHLTGPERIAFMEELWRVLAPGGTATIVTPYAWSWRAVADPTHAFPPVLPESYLYFNRQWRQDNRLGYYPIRCDFDFNYAYVFSPDVAFPDEAAQGQGLLHYLNVVDDLQVTLTKRG